MNDYPRGSQWRKWDLHIHTPYSALNNRFPKLKDGTPDWESYIGALESARDIAVIGATDYFSIEGYRKLRGFHADGRIGKIITVLPNIELRLSHLVGGRSSGTHRRLNLHVIFSDEVSPDNIEDQFLGDLRFTYEGTPDDPDDRWPVKRGSLESLGSRLKEEHPAFNDGRSDYEIGCMNAVVSIDDVKEALKKRLFKGRYVIVLAEEGTSIMTWDGQDHHVRKTLLQASHFIFSANPSTRDWALGKKDGEAEYIKEYKSLKACIHGSDAHEIDKLFEPDKERYCWIKADPTFRGLKTLLVEPEDRVHIGTIPDELLRLRDNKTKYMESIRIYKCSNANLPEQWFACDLSLNSGLISVIGNKGSGKSALTDSIGLAGNSRNYEDFSFLNSEKFLHPRSGKGKHFCAQLTWYSGGSSGEVCLDSRPKTSAFEYVKYLPQQYIEKICTELSTGERTAFDEELENVVFSHVRMSDRLGSASLQELLALRAQARGERGVSIRAVLRKMNIKIANIESRLRPEAQEKLREELAALKRQLAVIEKAKPESVEPPEADSESKDERDTAVQEINTLSENIATLDEELKKREADLAGANKGANQVQRLRALVKKLVAAYEEVKSEWESTLVGKQVRLAEIAILKIDYEPLDKIQQQIVARIAALQDSLNSGSKDSIAWHRMQVSTELENLREELKRPLLKYQAFKKELLTWERRKKDILGDEKTPGTIAYLEHQVDQIAELEETRRTLIDQRKESIRALYGEIQGVAGDYQELYEPIEGLVKTLPEVPSIPLELKVGVIERGFVESMMDFIDFGKRGNFYGREEGSKKMQQLLIQADFNDADGVLEFIESFLVELSAGRENVAQDRHLDEQLRKGKEVCDVYDYITCLEYLSPTYQLSWEGRPITRLSAGERGILLLVFYLLVDRNDYPLVFDQPEENLDNETVFRVLTRCIKLAKQRRQIIVVTHNPNLAVVCDSEQIIHATIDKLSGNKVHYESGSIENPGINEKLIRILEGTRPAFSNRDAKYRLAVME